MCRMYNDQIALITEFCVTIGGMKCLVFFYFPFEEIVSIRRRQPRNINDQTKCNELCKHANNLIHYQMQCLHSNTSVCTCVFTHFVMGKHTFFYGNFKNEYSMWILEFTKKCWKCYNTEKIITEFFEFSMHFQ